MSKPMQVDEAATKAAREAHEEGVKVLDAIFSYDRKAKAGDGGFAAASRLESLRQAIWSGMAMKRGNDKSGTIKPGNWDNPNWR